jgi:hypothetical protein
MFVVMITLAEKIAILFTNVNIKGLAEKKFRITHYRPVRLAYQPPSISTFLSGQISHQQAISQ